MKQQPQTFFSYHDNALHATHGNVVQEFPLQLIVNNREIATLIASPHDLRFLVAGFLRLQGFVRTLDDFDMFSVCEEFGTANVRIKGELPERLKPVLTSGCGAGISFSMPEAGAPLTLPGTGGDGDVNYPAHVFSLMNQLSSRADQYKSHGGIHSAAVGRNGELLLYAEDLGRHNTLDRIAGEALFRDIDLNRTELVTSGRISTEMVAKAALLGVRLIASRTSPTDMAIRLCEQSNICLVGYVRGGKFTVYCHPERIELNPEFTRIKGMTGAILAGGTSSRMGTNKALLKVGETALIEQMYRTLAAIFHEVIIVTNSPEKYAFIPCRKVADIYPGAGSIAGLHAAIAHSTSEQVFVTACDMPFINEELIRTLCGMRGDLDAVIPFSEGGQEPLHAVYGRSSLAEIQSALERGERKILDILKRLKTRLVSWDEIKHVPGAVDSFRNVNTPEEYAEINGV
ncbi:MAG: formate dehydrogenase accessory sulfurtransferase FdhD [Verrucomicrobia bacterium]|nr:formate dehydrogenase accessory sulfurtransferase FdhD [Deltaproteobacteria bacterium]